MCFERAQLELKLQRDRLKQYKKRIHGIMERETEIAKQLLKGRTPSCTHAFVLPSRWLVEFVQEQVTMAVRLEVLGSGGIRGHLLAAEDG